MQEKTNKVSDLVDTHRQIINVKKRRNTKVKKIRREVQIIKD